MDISNEFLKDLPSDKREEVLEYVNKMNMEYFQEVLTPVSGVYVDVRTLQDIYLGAYMLLAKGEEDLQVLRDGLEKYNSRITPQPFNYFKNFSSKKEEVERFISSKKNHKAIAEKSPFTSFFRDFRSLIKNVESHNRKLDQDGAEWNLYINTYPIQYPKGMMETYSGYIKHFSQLVRVGFVCIPHGKLTLKFMNEIDSFFFYDISSVVGVKSKLTKALIEDLAWVRTDKKCFSFPFIAKMEDADENTVDEYQYTVGDMFKRTAMVLNSLFDFQYVELPQIE